MRTIDTVRDCKISRVVQESTNIRSFYFKDPISLSSVPGQFVMVWKPGAGEFPMSLFLRSESGLASIGVKSMGIGSKVLYESKPGDYIGIRGPYGKGFEIEGMKKASVLLVGGGTGLVPMIVLAEALGNKGTKIHLVIGARTKNELPFLKVSKKIVGEKNVFTATDDGSLGFKGFAHELVLDLLSKEKYNRIFSCGPELMMAQVYKIAKRNHMPVQFSLERIMKCGIGICGSCSFGQYVLCIDGPVLDGQKLENSKNEFGISKRDKTGSMCSA